MILRKLKPTQNVVRNDGSCSKDTPDLRTLHLLINRQEGFKELAKSSFVEQVSFFCEIKTQKSLKIDRSCREEATLQRDKPLK